MTKRAHQLPKGQYPATSRGIAKFLQETEGLERDEAARVVNAVFSFIRMAVLQNGAKLAIYHFGAFSRRLRIEKETQYGHVPEQYVLHFTASRHFGRVRLEDDDGR